MRISRTGASSLLWVAGILASLYAGYVVKTWYSYGLSNNGQRRATRDPLLDQFIPTYEVAERHEIRISAPPAITFQVARELDLNDSRVVRVIFAIRTLPSRWHGEPTKAEKRGLVAGMLAIGWGVLAEVPDRAIVVGAVTQPWRPVVRFERLPPAEFAAFNQPGYAKIVWTLQAEPDGPARCLFRTETRVVTTDANARARFRRYWAVVSPGVLLIRRQALALLKARAEQQFREGPR